MHASLLIVTAHVQSLLRICRNMFKVKIAGKFCTFADVTILCMETSSLPPFFLLFPSPGSLPPQKLGSNWDISGQFAPARILSNVPSTVC